MHPDPPGRIVLFDGTCFMCSTAARTLMRLDRRHEFIMGALQSADGQQLLERTGQSRLVADTVVLIEGDRAYTRSTACIRIVWQLRMPWKLAAGLWVIPHPLRDWLYDIFARNRFRVIGQRPQCMALPPDHEARLHEAASKPVKNG